MKLYHTGNREIRVPDIHIGRSNADFGQGFYLCPDETFAGSWARERTAEDIYVNVYELDTDGLDIITLQRDHKWFEYIFRNRRGYEDRMGDHDVIIGPIANDTLFETYGIITSGLIRDEDALTLLDIGPEYTQVVIKTEKGAANLRWTGSYILDEEAIRSARSEYDIQSERYEEEFSAALESIDDAGSDS